MPSKYRGLHSTDATMLVISNLDQTLGHHLSIGNGHLGLIEYGGPSGQFWPKAQLQRQRGVVDRQHARRQRLAHLNMEHGGLFKP